MANQVSEFEIRALYEQYAHRIHARCYGILGSEDEAWDATQDVFMKLIKALPTIQKSGSILSWLYTTSTRHCISVLRKKRGVGFDESYHGGQAPKDAKRLVLKDVMEHMLKPWDEKMRRIVLYIYYDGFSQEEVSKLMGMGQSTIRRYLLKFKTKAKKWRSEHREAIYEL